MFDAIIISDIHLGSHNCEAKRLGHFLEDIHKRRLATKRLILNGDVFDSIDFRRLNKHHWRILSLIRKLSDEVEILWVCGNHDGSAETVSHLLGVQVKEEHVLESGTEKILVLHGHIFDEFLDAHPILTWIGDFIYWTLQLIDKSHSVARYAKHRSKIFLRCAQRIEEKSMEYAHKQSCSQVCCGHTHHAVTRHQNGVTYHNSGCWTERPCSYLTVADGVVEHHHYLHELAVDVDETVVAEPQMLLAYSETAETAEPLPSREKQAVLATTT